MTEEASGSTGEVWFVNRGILTVRGAEPYARWAEALDDGEVAWTEAGGWSTAYLIPQVDREEDAWEWIRENCATIFEIELEEWHLDRDAWPEDRSWDVFREWFELQYIEMGWDLVDEPLSSDPPPLGGGPRLLE